MIPCPPIWFIVSQMLVLIQFLSCTASVCARPYIYIRSLSATIHTLIPSPPAYLRFSMSASRGHKDRPPYETVAPLDPLSGDRPVSVDVSTRGTFRPPPTTSLSFPQMECITQCIQLVHYAHRFPRVSGKTPTRDDVVRYTAAWTRNFANCVDRTLDHAQRGCFTLKDILHSSNARSLHDFGSGFPDVIRPTQRDWSDSYASMVDESRRYRAALTVSSGSNRWPLFPKRGDAQMHFDFLSAVVGTMDSVIRGMASSMDWWWGISESMMQFAVVAREQVPGYHFDDALKRQMVWAIHVLESYHMQLLIHSTQLRKTLGSTLQGGDLRGGSMIGNSRRQ